MNAEQASYPPNKERRRIAHCSVDSIAASRSVLSGSLFTVLMDKINTELKMNQLKGALVGVSELYGATLGTPSLSEHKLPTHAAGEFAFCKRNRNGVLEWLWRKLDLLFKFSFREDSCFHISAQ